MQTLHEMHIRFDAFDFAMLHMLTGEQLKQTKK